MRVGWQLQWSAWGGDDDQNLTPPPLPHPRRQYQQVAAAVRTHLPGGHDEAPPVSHGSGSGHSSRRDSVGSSSSASLSAVSTEGGGAAFAEARGMTSVSDAEGERVVTAQAVVGGGFSIGGEEGGLRRRAV